MARIGDTARTSLKSILEAVLLAAGEPLSMKNIETVFTDDERPSSADIGKALEELADDYAERGLELTEVASGFRIQVREDTNPWVITEAAYFGGPSISVNRFAIPELVAH